MLRVVAFLAFLCEMLYVRGKKRVAPRELWVSEDAGDSRDLFPMGLCYLFETCTYLDRFADCSCDGCLNCKSCARSVAERGEALLFIDDRRVNDWYGPVEADVLAHDPEMLFS